MKCYHFFSSFLCFQSASYDEEDVIGILTCLAKSLSFCPEFDSEGNVADASVSMPESPKENLLVNLQNLGGYAGEKVSVTICQYLFVCLSVCLSVCFCLSISVSVADDCIT